MEEVDFEGGWVDRNRGNGDAGGREFSNPLAAGSSPSSSSRRSSNAGVGSVSEVRFNQIDVEVSLDDDDDDDVVSAVAVDEVDAGASVANATDFLAEHNDNYQLTWDEASRRISEADDDPSKPPRPGWNVPYARFRLRRVVESIGFRLATLALIVADIVIIVVDLCTADPAADGPSALMTVDLAITCYFVVEVTLRIVALTQPVFFSQWYNVVDFAVVLVTFILAVAAQVPGNGWSDQWALVSAVRLVRLARLARLYTEKRQVETAARQMVSQNKRRYQQDGFDLDLTYVTPRVVATSFPSTGLRALYRNPIEKVASFLDAKHRDRYMMYNLCSERSYDETLFHGRVRRVMIDDHNVPSLADMRDFARSAREWLGAHGDNVVVVHCKGGKGRTGTMICVWLVESGAFVGAASSLDYFGRRRTDTNVGSKFQGVETPSQARYVGYFERMKTELGGRLPPPSPLAIVQLRIAGVSSLGAGDGSDLWFQVCQGRGRQVFSAHLGYRRNCVPAYDEEADVLTVQVSNCPPLDGDVRVLFNSSSSSVPRGYEDCPFYFWFNTAFVDEEGGRFALDLTREELDNPHKSKTWHCFREGFSVSVVLVRPPPPATQQAGEKEKALHAVTTATSNGRASKTTA